MKDKQKQEFEEYNNFCKENNLKPCRIESTFAYFLSKQNDINL